MSSPCSACVGFTQECMRAAYPGYLSVLLTVDQRATHARSALSAGRHSRAGIGAQSSWVRHSCRHRRADVLAHSALASSLLAPAPRAHCLPRFAQRTRRSLPAARLAVPMPVPRFWQHSSQTTARRQAVHRRRSHSSASRLDVPQHRGCSARRCLSRAVSIRHGFDTAPAAWCRRDRQHHEQRDTRFASRRW